MSQLWASTALSQVISTILQNLSDKCDSLRTVHSGSSAPGSTVAGMLWWDTSTAAGPLKQRNQANSAWVTLIPDTSVASGALLPLSGGTMTGIINMGAQRIENLGSGNSTDDAPTIAQVDSRLLSSTVHLGTVSATDEKMLFITHDNSTDIVDVIIANENGVAADGANKWTFQVRDLTGAVNLLSAAKDTSAAAITADTAYALGVNQNNTALAALKVLELQMTKTGAPNNLQELIATVKFKITTL